MFEVCQALNEEKMKKKKTPTNYVDNSVLLEEMKKYIKRLEEAENQGDDMPIIPDTIGKAIKDIAENTSKRGEFCNYPFRDEMVADGIESAVKAVPKFTPEKSENPFGFFTRTIWWAFLRRIQSEKDELYTKYKTAENIHINGMHVSGEETVSIGFETTDNMDEFIRKYEAKKKERAERAKYNRQKRKERLERGEE